MTAVEIDAVTCIEYENLGIDRELQRSVDDEVKLLSVMCVLVVIASIGQWIDSDKEWIDLSAAETCSKRLVSIVISTVDLLSLASASDEVTAHAWLLTKEQNIEIDAIAFGDLAQTVDRRIGLTGLDLLVMLQGDTAEVGDLLSRNIQNFA